MAIGCMRILLDVVLVLVMTVMRHFICDPAKKGAGGCRRVSAVDCIVVC